MIISRTPCRVSFAGGGTDLRAFYQHEPGAVVGTAIDKYIYITINKRFDETIRAGYSKTEIVDDVAQIQHPIIREAMKITGVTSGIEITSIADLPAGTGMGTSSSFAVGLLNALYAYKNEHKTAEELARDAVKIEVNILKEPIGKQDQYFAAYGGLKHFVFNSDETVYVEPIICYEKTRKTLGENLLLFYTGITRNANSVLKKQKESTEKKMIYLGHMKEMAQNISNALVENDLSCLGTFLNDGWQSKKQLVDTISNPVIDFYYERGIAAGASGGKLLGAGNGGFLLFYCTPQNQAKLRNVLGLREISFSLEPQGSKIIYVGN